jgi:hypothetical protein
MVRRITDKDIRQFFLHKYLCRLFSKRPKTIFVLRRNQISLINFLCGIAYFYAARKWFCAVLKITYTFIPLQFIESLKTSISIGECCSKFTKSNCKIALILTNTKKDTFYILFANTNITF